MSAEAAPEVLFSAAEIAVRIDELAAEIEASLGRDIVAVPVLTGAIIFAADLVRALWRVGVAVEMLPVRVRSYGASTSAEQPPSIVMPLDKRLDGRAVLAVDGVCDAGHTLEAVLRHVRECGAARIASAVLVDKPARRAVPLSPDFIGFPCEDQFVVGYGMDAAGRLRHLPYVGFVRS